MNNSKPSSMVIKLVVLVAIVSVSVSGIIIRLSEVHYIALAVYRMLITVIIMLPKIIFDKQSNEAPKKLASTKEKVNIVLLSIASGLMLTFHFSFWYQSLHLTTISNATILANTHPLFILILGFLFLKEKVDSKSIKWMILAVAGTACITLFSSELVTTESSSKGNLYALFAAIFFSGYLLIGRYVRQRVTMTRYTFVVYLVSFISFLVYALLTSVPLGPFPIREYGIFLALAIFPTLLGHSLFNWSLKYLKMAYVSTAMLLEPLFATILALFIFKEIPSISTLVFGPVIIFSIYRFSTLNDETHLTDVDL